MTKFVKHGYYYKVEPENKADVIPMLEEISDWGLSHGILKIVANYGWYKDEPILFLIPNELTVEFLLRFS